MSLPYDPKSDPESYKYQRVRERGVGSQPYSAKDDPNSRQHQSMTVKLAEPVAGSLVKGIVLFWIVAPIIWGITAGIYGGTGADGTDPVGVMVVGAMIAVVVAIVGLVRTLRAVHVLAARSDRAAARELAE